MVYYGKDNKYKDILTKLSGRLGQSKDHDLAALLVAFIELLDYLDEKELKKTQPTFD